jgi:hypothetical protein
MCKFDLRDGFYHCPVAARFVPFMGITLPNGRFAVFRFLCFGLKIAPFIFQGTMMELRRMLIANGINCFIAVHIDDWILMAPTARMLEAARELFIRAMTDMGFLLHDSRQGYPPSPSHGVHWHYHQPHSPSHIHLHRKVHTHSNTARHPLGGSSSHTSRAGGTRTRVRLYHR